jgi:HEAT repeat protein
MSLPVVARRSADELVQDLAIRHRHKDAYRRLIVLRTAATPAVRRGLCHSDAVVRIGCCKVLDHFLDEDALPGLLENLRHEDAGVRTWALHALACDRCKEGACRPAESDVMPVAIELLLGDPNRQVRQMVAGLVGLAVHRSGDAAEAMARAAKDDPHPVVRKIARWFVPGGPRYERLRPKACRAVSRSSVRGSSG